MAVSIPQRQPRSGTYLRRYYECKELFYKLLYRRRRGIGRICGIHGDTVDAVGTNMMSKGIENALAAINYVGLCWHAHPVFTRQLLHRQESCAD